MLKCELNNIKNIIIIFYKYLINNKKFINKLLIKMIKIIIITLFPNIFNSFLDCGLLKKAIKKKLLNIKLLDLKDFSNKRVDDYSYGGGEGMVLSCLPLYKAILKAKEILKFNSKVIYFTPKGKIFSQNYIKKISYKNNNIILICGRYEGIDNRIIKKEVDEEISIGDFILSGGEIPSMVFIDSLYRLIPRSSK